MGKVRNKKSRIHLKATKVATNDKEIEPEESNDYNNNDKAEILPNLENNPFLGLKIDPALLTKQSLQESEIENNDASGKTKFLSKKRVTESFGETVKTKKEKMNRRREMFLQKLEVNQRIAKKQKQAKQRAKNPVVGDMHGLKLALTEIPKLRSEIPTVIAKTKKKSRRKRKKESSLQKVEKVSLTDKDMRRVRSKRTQKHMLNEIAKLQSMMKDKSYQSNSKEIILKNIKQHLVE
ncbi:uncharacterized protein LOC100179345 [Ciona intestinalis]